MWTSPLILGDFFKAFYNITAYYSIIGAKMGHLALIFLMKWTVSKKVHQPF